MSDISQWRRNVSNITSSRSQHLNAPPQSLSPSQISAPSSPLESPIPRRQSRANLLSPRPSVVNFSALFNPRQAIPARVESKSSSLSRRSSFSDGAAQWEGYNDQGGLYAVNPKEMADTVLRKLMSHNLHDPLPARYNSRLLHIIEAYRNQEAELTGLRNELEAERVARQEEAETFKKAGRVWEKESDAWKSEVKRLEVLIANGQTGVEGVALARVDSLVHRRRRPTAKPQEAIPEQTKTSPRVNDVFSRRVSGRGVQGYQDPAVVDAISSKLFDPRNPHRPIPPIDTTVPHLLSDRDIQDLNSSENVTPKNDDIFVSNTGQEKDGSASPAAFSTIGSPIPRLRAQAEDRRRLRQSSQRDFSFALGDDQVPLDKREFNTWQEKQKTRPVTLLKLNTNFDGAGSELTPTVEESPTRAQNLAPESDGEAGDIKALGAGQAPAREGSSSSVTTVKRTSQTQMRWPSDKETSPGGQSNLPAAIAAARAAAKSPPGPSPTRILPSKMNDGKE